MAELSKLEKNRRGRRIQMAKVFQKEQLPFSQGPSTSSYSSSCRLTVPQSPGVRRLYCNDFPTTRPLPRQLIALLLLMGNIESNPGPKRSSKQTNTCTVCHRFVSKGAKFCKTHLNRDVNSDKDLGAIDDLHFQETFPICDKRSGSETNTNGDFTINQQHDEVPLPTVSTAVTDSSFLWNIATADYLRGISADNGFSSACDPPTLITEGRQIVVGCVPSTTYAIPGDGDCLFSTLGVLLTGTIDHAREMRSFICGFMRTITLTAQHFLTYATHPCDNAEHYITNERMNESGVFGGDLEIAAFCTAFSLEVIAYASDARIWMRYVPLGATGARQQLAIVHKNNHWEPVTRVFTATSSAHKTIGLPRLLQRTNNNSTEAEGTRKRKRPSCDEFSVSSSNGSKTTAHGFVQPVRPPILPLSTQGFLHFETRAPVVQAENWSFNKQKVIERVLGIGMCEKCMRNSTTKYPLLFEETDKRLNAGQKRGRTNSYGVRLLCNLCLNSVESGSCAWRDKWPSVLCFLLLQQPNSDEMNDLLRKLPETVKSMWSKALKAKEMELDGESVFDDLTEERNDLHRLLEVNTAETYTLALKKYPFPSVRCFCGSSEFLERCGSVDFQHVLNFVDPSFKTCKANCRKFINCARRDFLEKCDDGLIHGLRPAIFLDSDNGLQIATCRKHDGGSKLNLIHVPRHPVVNNLSHKWCDRFAPLVASLRDATPTKVGAFSHTWTMTKSIGGAGGVGSLVLHGQRPFNIHSQFLLPGTESLFLNNRLDMKANMSIIETDNFLPPDFVEWAFKKVPLSKDRYARYVAPANYVPLRVIQGVKNFVDKASSGTISFKRLSWFTSRTLAGGDVASNVKLPYKKLLQVDISTFFMSFVCLNFEEISSEVASCPKNSPLYIFCDLMNSKELTVSELNSKASLFKTGLKISTDDDFFSAFKCFCHCFSNLFVTTYDNLISCNCLPYTIDLVFVVKQAREQCPDVVTAEDGSQFHLVLLTQNPSRSDVDAIIRVRHTDTFWCVCYCKQNIQPCNTNTLNHYQKYCLLVAYQRPPTIPHGITNYVGVNHNVYCPKHELILCCDFPLSSAKCFHEGCKRKTKWRCPQTGCKIACCGSHLKVLPCDINLVSSPDLSFDNDDDTADIGAFEDPDAVVFDDNYHQELTMIATNELNPPVFPNIIDDLCDRADTDATQIATKTDHEDSQNHRDAYSAPIQALFNTVFSVLHRKENPINSTKRTLRFFQTFVARSHHRSICLLQLEAMLFPSIFYHQNTDGSFPGALPFYLFDSRPMCNKLGFESLEEHFRVRLTDTTLLTSANNRYLQFATDCLLNLNLNRHHSNEFFQRGIQAISHGRDNYWFVKGLGRIGLNSDCRVNELASAIRSDPVSLFLTLTCNQRLHPGVAPLWETLRENFENEDEDVHKTAVSSYMISFVRCWSRAVQLLITYLHKSAEQPLGPVKKIWGRAEFQSTTGNLPHYHVLLWINMPTEQLLEKIQSSEKTLYYEFQKILNDQPGLIGSWSDMGEKYELCIKLHTHDCERSQWRCLKRRDVEGNFICRTQPFPQSHCHWLMQIEQQYPKEALLILKELSLAEETDGFPNCLRVTGHLKCEKWMYAATEGEHIIPTSAYLFNVTQSSTNLLATTPKFSASYLTTYAAKSEEHADAELHPQLDGKSFRLRTHGIENRYLASVTFIRNHLKNLERQQTTVPCRLLAATESAFWVLQEPYILTSMNFVHVANVEPEKRSVIRTLKDNTTHFTSNDFFDRNAISGLPLFKQVTQPQQDMLNDIRHFGEQPDKMTQFSLRPPELLYVNSVERYYKWFRSTGRAILTRDLISLFRANTLTPLVDALGNVMLLREEALTHLINYNREQRERVTGYQESIAFVDSVLLYLETSSLPFPFLDTSSDEKAICEVVFRSVNPLAHTPFLISFLLRFGCFETELQLFGFPSLVESFVQSGLIAYRENYNEEDVLQLLRIYCLSELAYLPGSALTFSGKLIAAKSAFSSLLSVANPSSHVCPTVLLRHMQEEQLESVREFLTSVRRSLYSYFQSLLGNGVPTFSDHYRDQWNVTWPTRDLFEESKREQQQTFSHIQSSIDIYRSNLFFQSSHIEKHHLIIGPPGTGKSFVSGCALAYAFFNGLKCFVTSVAARRASQLGGEHIHRLFHVPVKNLPAASLAHAALMKLNSDPRRKTLLTDLDVLLIEEISLISAELWATIDLILQKLKGNDSSFGGVLVIANGDCCQLPTVSGHDVFLSTSVIFNFHFYFLNHHVRMTDTNGRRLLRLLEPRPVNEVSANDAINIISTNCTFLDSWLQLSDLTVMKVFGKRSAEQEAVGQHSMRIKDSGILFFICKAKDEIRNPQSNLWIAADEKVTNFLDRNCREPSELICYPKAVLRITQNFGAVMQGQLCVVNFELSSETTIVAHTASNPQSITAEVLQNNAFLTWPCVHLSRKTGFVVAFHTSSVRRQQLPCSNYVALTIHKLMGDTFSSIATSVSTVENRYSLWLTSQIYVLLSRVHNLENVTFVGKKSATLAALRTVLLRRNQHEERVYKFVNNFNHRNMPTRRNNENPVFQIHLPLKEFVVPKQQNGFVFILTSLSRHASIPYFVGETSQSLSTRLRELNSTDWDSFMYQQQPWAPVLFIWNFMNDSSRLALLQVIEEVIHSRSRLSVWCVIRRVKEELTKWKLNLCVCVDETGDIENI